MGRMIGSRALLGLFLLASWASIAADSQWTQSVSLPEERVLSGAAEMDGVLYLVGGGSAGGRETATDTVFALDPVTEIWSALPRMLEVRHSPYLLPLDGKLYVLGGNNPGFEGLFTGEVFDPVTGSWSSIPDAPCRLAANEGVAGVIDERPVAFARFCAFLEYDPVTQEWTILSTEHTTLSASAFGAIGSKVYQAGGYDDGESQDVLRAFDTRTGEWETLSPMHTPRMLPNGVAARGRFFVFGGFDSFDPGPALDVVEVYDPATDTWTELPSMPGPLAGAAGSTLGLSIHLLGGVPELDGTGSPPGSAAHYVFDELDHGDKVCICHVPQGNPDHPKTMCVGVDAAYHHVNQHGDTFGECP